MIEVKQINNIFFQVVGSGFRTLTTNFTTAPLNTVTQSNSFFSVSGGVVTYSGHDSQALIMFTASGDAASSTRSTMESALFVNGVVDSNSVRHSYHRNLLDGEGDSSYFTIVDISDGDTFEMRNREQSNGDNVIQNLTLSNLIIILL